MTGTIAVAAISAGSTLLVSIAALVLNFRLFGSLEKRIEVLEKLVPAVAVLTVKTERMEHNLEVVAQDIKQFFQELTELDKRVAKIEPGGSK